MTHETTGELDQAISDYSQEMALSPLGRTRLADAYCRLLVRSLQYCWIS